MANATPDAVPSTYMVDGVPLSSELLDAAATVAVLGVIRDCSLFDLLRIIVRVRYLGWLDETPT